MTELNQNDLPEAAPEVAWPELPLSGAEDSEATASDGAVQAVLRRVRDLPGLPVSEHHAAYADMHDALLEALNEDPSSAASQGHGRGPGPRPGAGSGAA
jgi:hypothetical protein